jgi:hypothetical protein
LEITRSNSLKSLLKVLSDDIKRLDTSRSQLDRLLDPSNDGVTLAVLSRAAQVVGRSIRLELVRILEIHYPRV